MFKFIKITSVAFFLTVFAGTAVACDAHTATVTAKDNYMSLWVFGMIFSGILAAKAGVGGGLAGLNKREIIFVAVLYSFIIIPAGFIFKGGASLSIILKLLNIFLFFYAIMSLVLIAAGVYTVKKWQRGFDVSKRSFWVMVCPCPLTIVSIILVLSFMPVDLSDLWAGILVAGGLFIIIMAAYFASKLKVSPLNLGNLMTASGLGLMITVLIVPAYLEVGISNGFGVAGSMMPTGSILVPVVFCSVFIMLGIVIEFIKSRVSLWKG
ncbi:DUF2162 domain-containing protein [Peptococcaceae bacterium]|nr:DUF2162 domain-containing protein [Peptococcaceae bacterium]